MYDPTFLPVTLVLLILIGIIVVMDFHKFIPVVVLVYLLYVLFIFVFDKPQPQPMQTSSSIMKLIEPLPVTNDSVLIAEKEFSKVEPPKEEPYQPLQLNKIQISKGIDVSNRSTIESGQVFPDTIQYLYCFTGIDNRHGKGSHKIRHSWIYNSRELTTVNMDIERSIHWRCWSRINISPLWTGDWSVSVRDSNNIEFGRTRFSIVPTDTL